jgi:integrase/recombinase XerD
MQISRFVCKLYATSLASKRYKNESMSLPRTATILDKRKIKTDNTYPVKLRVTFERKQQYYATPYDFTEKEFDRIMYGKKLSNSEKILKVKVTSYENKAINVIKNLTFFTWKLFEKHYLVNKAARDTINSAFTDYTLELRKEGRIGTAVSYECAQKSLDKFVPGAKFPDVTPELLRKYEKWMLKEGNSITTVGIYLRSLRTLFNNIIGEGILTREYYPFGKKRYEIPTGKNIKKALTLKDIGTIYYYNPEAGTMAERAKDYWMFMYLCNGMNVKDMSLLTYSNIKGDVLEFIRAKTVRTKRKVEPIRVVLTDEVKTIIQKWGNKDKDASNFIFPILEKGLKPERERQLIQQLTGVINDHMKAIVKKIGIESDCTTYAARHSFSTILQRSGASTEFISEALGHSSVKTTVNYLAGFEDETKKETVKALMAFKKKLDSTPSNTQSEKN